MLADGSLNADRVWKRFRADRHRSLLRDEVARLRMRGDGAKGWAWAVRDASFRIEPGESVALIGSNGSGKSTMLKMLVGVMFPYAGRLDSRFDDVIDFAGLTGAVDRQVKFFSSGMAMRLGFGVAAFLDPAILVVDEVLSVGDAQFQQRCLDRMREVLASGTTLVYVSHDLASVEAMCRKTVWLDRGEMRFQGPTRQALHAYRQSVEIDAGLADSSGSETVRTGNVQVCGLDHAPPTSGRPLNIVVELRASSAATGTLVIGVSEGTATPIFVVQNEVRLSADLTEVSCTLSSLPVPAGKYAIWTGFMAPNGSYLAKWRPAVDMVVEGVELLDTPTGVVRLSPVYVEAQWSV